MTNIYVLVADGTRARVFVTDKPKGPLREVEDMVHPEGRLAGHDLTSDAPGRTHDRAGQGRHALVEPTDAKHVEHLAFARRIAQYFKGLHAREADMQIVLVAGAELRGMLHKQFDKQTARAVSREVDKNITHLKAAEISKRLGFTA